MKISFQLNQKNCKILKNSYHDQIKVLKGSLVTIEEV